MTWYQFDQDNEDPANDEAVGNAYLRDTIPQFNEAFAGKWNWVNVPKAWDKMPAELVAAVQAGGDVPDLMQGSDSNIAEPVAQRRPAGPDRLGRRRRAGTRDMDPSALKACTVGRQAVLSAHRRGPLCDLCLERPLPQRLSQDARGVPEAEAERLKEEGDQHHDLLWLDRL